MARAPTLGLNERAPLGLRDFRPGGMVGVHLEEAVLGIEEAMEACGCYSSNGDAIEVVVRRPSGEGILVGCEDWMTAGGIKCMLCGIVGVEPSRMRLLFGLEELRDREFLTVHDVVSGSELTLLVDPASGGGKGGFQCGKGFGE